MVLRKRSDLEDDLKTFNCGSPMLTRDQIAAYCNVHRCAHIVGKIINGLPKFGTKYHAGDISERLWSMRTIEEISI